LAKGLEHNGHVAIYGVYFDTDSARIKPASGAQLEEMAKYLKAHPHAGVYIVGHTDNQGKLAYNLDLSRRRAKAVVDTLVAQYHVPAARLTAEGVGPLAPVAANASDAGRAKNRRVELVLR
jgi:outer membrane protein OmpA-like peptidoglycan-associated protein